VSVQVGRLRCRAGSTRGGTNAIAIDFTQLANKLPLFVGVVVLLSALLLLVVFRSLVIPLQAAVMNLLSIGASLGVVVAIFQWGWLGGLFNVKGAPIQAFIPVMLFAIVSGLSIDYEVFLVSRIHEEWTRTRKPHKAVGHALASTGRVITAAATIMICVFLSFVAGGERILELFAPHKPSATAMLGPARRGARRAHRDPVGPPSVTSQEKLLGAPA
jgi:putative drug exporter of the RND superfamily